MSTQNLKSSKLHPYQKLMTPFWRHSNLPATMGYSDSTKEMLELRKIEYDSKAKYVAWKTKPDNL